MLFLLKICPAQIWVFFVCCCFCFCLFCSDSLSSGPETRCKLWSLSYSDLSCRVFCVLNALVASNCLDHQYMGFIWCPILNIYGALFHQYNYDVCPPLSRNPAWSGTSVYKTLLTVEQEHTCTWIHLWAASAGKNVRVSSQENCIYFLGHENTVIAFL